MNTNAQALILTRFYSGYAPDAVFDDPALSLKGQREVAGMWRMLCAVTQAKGGAQAAANLRKFLAEKP